MKNSPILVLACSPRAQGNSDFMAEQFVQGVRHAKGNVELVYLRDFNISPCKACDICFDGTHCALEKQDDTAALFAKLEAAPLVFIAAPIFFYHLPAQLKAFIDRSQYYWARLEKQRKAQIILVEQAKPALVALVGARSKGEKLFEGSLLTLEYFLQLFNMEIFEACKMYGYDKVGELAADVKASKQFFELGQDCVKLLNKNHFQ